MSSSDSEWKESLAPSSPVSPRKRRRSSSVGSTQSRKRATIAPYNDAYRLLYNDFVQTTTGGQDEQGPLPWKPSQLGVSLWSASEKAAFFTALDRCGKDNLHAIAAVVKSKSIPEIRQFLLLLQDTLLDQPTRQGKRQYTVSLRDIPAASEISVVCDRKLEAAGDTLAVMQERFEASQEQKRYGEQWIINSRLADQIELTVQGTRAAAPVESEVDDDGSEEVDNSPLLKEIPEAKLLIPKTFLELSRNVFMNPSPSTSYPWPHWQDLASESAPEPSMYRTALRDFNTLVLSVTKRIMQTALVQATSRIRSQGWRSKKGVSLYVRSRDVRTALDLLGMKRSRKQYWRDVPRRCRLEVTQGKHRKLRAYRWDEVERILDSVENRSTPLDLDADTIGPGSDAEHGEFKFRAARSGTPLPAARPLNPINSEDGNDDASVEETDSDVYQVSEPGSEALSVRSQKMEEGETLYDFSEAELQGLEELDQERSRQEERTLWSIIGHVPANDQRFVGLKSEPQERKVHIPHRKTNEEIRDWRAWTQYHAEWEEYRTPVPAASFTENQKSPSSAPAWDSIQDNTTEYETEAGWSEEERILRKRRPAPGGKELPLRDARSYAAMQSMQCRSEERNIESDASGNDAEIPAQSIEIEIPEEINTSVMEEDTEDTLEGEADAS